MDHVNIGMRYANILSNAITESGMTYSQISLKCQRKNGHISRTYLSQLCTGKKPPASDEMNKILVDVLSPLANISYEDLVFSKYTEILSPEVVNIILNRGAMKCEISKTS